MTTSASTVQHVPNDQETEVMAIRDLVATVESVQRQERVDEFVSLFRSDAIWTTGYGRRLFGRDAIAAYTATVLPGSSAHGRARCGVEHV